MAGPKTGKRSLETDDVNDKDADLCAKLGTKDAEMPKKRFKTLQFEEGECDFEDAIARITDYQKQAMLSSVKDVLQLETRHHQPKNTPKPTCSTPASPKTPMLRARKALAPTRAKALSLPKEKRVTRRQSDRLQDKQEDKLGVVIDRGLLAQAQVLVPRTRGFRGQYQDLLAENKELEAEIKELLAENKELLARNKELRAEATSS